MKDSLRARGSDRCVTRGRENTTAERASAVQLVRRNARDADDLRHLLNVLDLDPTTTQGEWA